MENPGYKFTFVNGYGITKKASLMTNPLKAEIKKTAAEAHNIEIQKTGELIGTEQDVKAFNETVTAEFKLRSANLSLKNFEAVPVEKLHEAILKSVIIDVQNVYRTKYSDAEICKLIESGTIEIDLKHFYETEKTGRIAQSDFTKASKLVDKQELTREQKDALIEQLKQ